MKKYLSLSKSERKELARYELCRVANLLGRTPTKDDFRAVPDTQITYGQIIYLYQKWNLALRDANLKTNKRRQPDMADDRVSRLVDAFIDVANIKGRMPIFREFREHHNISLSSFIAVFGSWSQVKSYVYAQHRERLAFLPQKIVARRVRRTKAQIAADRAAGKE